MKTSIKARCSITLGALLLTTALSLTPLIAATTTNPKMHGAADKRQSQSISEDWNNADAVCAGKLRKGNGAIGATLLVTEILKGDSKLNGTTLPIPLERHLAGIFPNDGNEKPAVVFFSRDASTKELMATEIYNDPDKISATRCLSPIFEGMSEKLALQALADMTLDPSSRCKATFKQDAKILFRKEFLAALGRMRDKNNFSIVTRLYEKADQGSKHDLLDWMACTGDNRAIPYLIAAVPSADRTLRSTALTRLMYYYPGEQGVDDCVEHAYEHGFADTKNAARNYIMKRRKGISDKPASHQTKTNYQQAEELYEQDKFKQATALYVREILTNTKDSYARRWSALKAIPYATSQQKDEIRKSMLPLLAEDAATSNYIEATDAAEILQKLENIDCLDSMIKLLDRKEPLFGKANRMAAFGIARLNSAARHKAAEHLIEQIKSDKFKNSNDQQNQLLTLLELVWIGDSKDIQTVDGILSSSNAANVWKSLHPLLAKNANRGSGKSEGTFLLELLKNNSSLPHLAKDWVIVELGDLKETRAADLILAHMIEMKYQYDYNVAGDALKSMGSKHVSDQLEKIALSNDEVSRNAVDILCAIEKEKSLPALRKIINSKSIAKTNALTALARMGTPEDLIELVPLSNYWTGDRQYHYWFMEAVATIRERYSLNVSGPIRMTHSSDKAKA